jgi:hypothetical protein
MSGCDCLNDHFFFFKLQGTKFNRLNITVTPKLGRALLWPSVLNDRPHHQDERTYHEALPVDVGVKYGANAWCKCPHTIKIGFCSSPEQ